MLLEETCSLIKGEGSVRTLPMPHPPLPALEAIRQGREACAVGVERVRLTPHCDIAELLSTQNPCLKTCHDKAAGEHTPWDHTTLEPVKSWL